MHNSPIINCDVDDVIHHQHNISNHFNMPSELLVCGASLDGGLYIGLLPQQQLTCREVSLSAAQGGGGRGKGGLRQGASQVAAGNTT